MPTGVPATVPPSHLCTKIVPPIPIRRVRPYLIGKSVYFPVRLSTAISQVLLLKLVLISLRVQLHVCSLFIARCT